MIRVSIEERPRWEERAHEMGFKFHTLYGDKYWDESRYYQFTLKQIEEDLEEPTRELHAMCLKAVEKVVHDDDMMRKFAIPEALWSLVRASWERRDASLYGRFDFVYSGMGPAKMLEYNADTPTSLYESGYWQWLWLEDQATTGMIPNEADQFNSLQEKLIMRFHDLKQTRPGETLHFSCVEASEEDRGTVQYLEDCAAEAGIECKFVDVEDIGEGTNGEFTDLDDQVITWLFKLYPLEFMFREDYSRLLEKSGVALLEPYWKAILSNKAILPVLWDMFPNHPNLLPAYFSREEMPSSITQFVRKPIFAREGCNVSVFSDGKEVIKGEGPYGEEGWVYQALAPLPKFGEDFTLIGSWVIGDEPAGISIREDSNSVTQDMSRFIPHIIM